MPKKILLIAIEDVRTKLNKLTQYRTLNDPGVIALSEKMDNLIVKFHKLP
ncbi:MAG: Spo0E like sporulation regulatory protein [Firmicutes bacterium]|nr:Spo0E like sporulation regulatory protein [Bacillota bacterium]